MGAQRRQAIGDAHGLHDLPGGRGLPIAQRVQDAKLQPVNPGLVGQPVIQGFLPKRRLRHAKAAKRP